MNWGFVNYIDNDPDAVSWFSFMIRASWFPSKLITWEIVAGLCTCFVELTTQPFNYDPLMSSVLNLVLVVTICELLWHIYNGF